MNKRTLLLFFLVVFVVLVAFLLGLKIGRADLPEAIERIDTIYYEKPQPINVEAHPITIRVPQLMFAERVVEVEAEPTIIRIPAEKDSVEIAAYLETKQYQDSTYRAQISGIKIGDYEPRLDWIEVYNKTTTTIVQKRPKIAVTAGVGVGLTPKGIQPMVGVSAGIILWSK